MTELEPFTIHPPVPPNPWPADNCMRKQTDPWWWASVQWDLDRRTEGDNSWEQRFRDGELEAQYWKAVAFPRRRPGTLVVLSRRTDFLPGEREENIWYRFAMLPDCRDIGF